MAENVNSESEAPQDVVEEIIITLEDFEDSDLELNEEPEEMHEEQSEKQVEKQEDGSILQDTHTDIWRIAQKKPKGVNPYRKQYALVRGNYEYLTYRVLNEECLIGIRIIAGFC